MRIMNRPNRVLSQGFSLVELMIALVVGLIVVGAVLALVVSMIAANNQTIQATRLTQELRATAAVIASDLRRARGVDDPFAAAKQGNAFATVDTSTAGCIIYGYAGAQGGDYHVIRLSGSKVVMSATDTAANATCALAGQQLSSAQVNVDALAFTVNGRRIVITLTGSLANPPPGAESISRTFSQTVFIRSVGS